jgi:hypothetical protein
MSLANDIYNLYPRHLGKRAAIVAIEKTLRRLKLELKNEGINVGDEVEWLKERVSAFAESSAGKRGNFTPHPSTWFNQGRYLDDQGEWNDKAHDVWAQFMAKGIQ